MSLPINQQPCADIILSQLLQAEVQHRADKRKNMFLRLSKLRYQATLHDINCSAKRNLSKEQLAKITDTAYLDRAQNIIITGATGCGKSYLSCALGHHACLNGYRTLYFNLNLFIEKLALAELDGSKLKWFNQLSKASLLILDDFGLQPLNHSILVSLLQILEDRYGKSSTIICSQIPVEKWQIYLNEPTLSDAILDRLVHNAHRINLTGKSLRKTLN